MSITKKSKRGYKAYLERSKKLDAKWAKKRPTLDELIEDLEWLVGIKP